MYFWVDLGLWLVTRGVTSNNCNYVLKLCTIHLCITTLEIIIAHFNVPFY